MTEDDDEASNSDDAKISRPTKAAIGQNLSANSSNQTKPAK